MISSETISATRVTYEGKVSFSQAEARLRSSIQKNGKESGGVAPWSSTIASAMSSTSEFEAWVEQYVGPHGFMHFGEFNHGAWLRLYGPATSRVTTTGAAAAATDDDVDDEEEEGTVKDLRAIRFILGNPLIAYTMLQHDLDAGLSVPVELLLKELPLTEKGVRIVHFKPSGLVAGYPGATPDLVAAATILDAKVEALIRWVLRDEE